MSTPPAIRLVTTELLSELRALLADRGARVAHHWRPQRRTAEEIAQAVDEIGLSLPTELATWWSIHDGAGVDGEPWTPNVSLRWWPLSVDEAIEDTLLLRRIFAELDQPNPWSDDWIVFGFDGGKGRLVCDGTVAAGEPTPVRTFFVDFWTQPLPMLPSIGALVTFWIEALEDGTLRVDDDGRFAFVEPDEMQQARGELSTFL